jgi:hypothetical protein
MRRLMLEATRINEEGGTPRGVDPEPYRKKRAYDALVPLDDDWRKVMEDDLVAKW